MDLIIFEHSILSRLENCSWTQLADSRLSISKRLQWQLYRDDLREILSALNDGTLLPENVIMPTEPAEE